ncbi:MAG TPA: hypothetical protein DCG57_16115 [Candidatus Riflebacteria bacterium]|jgi:hypothetical protein|nr:hypothetical protein [Candidatus Riflebacteria bacterium]
MTEGSLVDTPLLLPPELERRQNEFCEYLQSSRKRLDEFASRHELGYLLDKTFVDSWEVFSEKSAFDRRLCALLEMPEETILPVTFSAALERRVLMSVTPEIYLKNYPQGHEPDAYPKLLCHEMAHRLHIRILDGNEEAMGPTWFYEGFALFAASQFSDAYQPFSREELQKLFSEQERGDYRRYAAAFRQLASMVDSLADLLAWPEKPDFMQRIESLIETAEKSGHLKNGK